MPGGGRRRGAGRTHGRKDSGESKGEANKDEEACAVCVLGEVTAEQHFLALELQEHPAALHGTVTSGQWLLRGKRKIFAPESRSTEVRWGFPPCLPRASLACAQPPSLRSSRGSLLLAGSICNV